MVVVVVWVVGNMRGSRGGGQRGQQVCMCPRWVALKEETACKLLLNRTTLLQPDTRCACVSLTLNVTWSPFLKVFCHQRHDGQNHMLVSAVNNGKHKVSYRHMSNFFLNIAHTFYITVSVKLGNLTGTFHKVIGYEATQTPPSLFQRWREYKAYLERIFFLFYWK